MKLLNKTILLSIFLVFNIWGATQSEAQTAFPCDGKLYFFGDSSGIGMLSYIDNYPNFTTSHNVCQMPFSSYNAMAANPVDHYIYFQNGGNLYKLDNTCTSTMVCSGFGSPVQGCFDYLGRYWYVNGSSVNRLDLSTCVSTTIGTVPTGNGLCIDFAFNPSDCSFYWVGSDSIYQVDSLGAVINTRAGGFGAVALSNTFGGVAIGYSNYFYGMTNSSAILYQVNLTTGTVDSLYQVPTGNTGYDMASFLCNPVNANFAANPDSICPGFPVQFVDSGFGLNHTVFWNFGDTLSGNADTSSLFNPVHVYDSAGTYTVKLIVTSNPGTMCVPGGMDSITRTIVVYHLPTANAGADHAYCLGDSVQLNGSGTGHFLWSPNIHLSCDTCPNPIASPTTTTTYVLIVTDSTTGCLKRDTALITVKPLPIAPTITVTGSMPFCPGDSVLLNGTGIGRFNWSSSLTLSCDTCHNPYSYPSITTTYILMLTDSATGCSSFDSVQVTVHPPPTISLTGNHAICLGDSTALHGTGSGNLLWSPSSSLSCPTCPDPIAHPSISTLYHLSVTDTVTGCISKDSILLSVNPHPAITVSHFDSLCVGDSVNLNGSATGNSAWLWSPSNGLSCSNCPNPFAFPASSSWYHLVVTDTITGCFSFDSVYVKVNPNPILIVAGDSTVCFGDSTLLVASGGTSYQWNTGPTNDTLVANPSFNYTYSVVAFNGFCYSSASHFIKVIPSPAPPGFDTSICKGDVITINIDGRPILEWFANDSSTVPIFSGSSFTTPRITSDIMTYYIASDSANCRSKLIAVTIFGLDCPVVIPNVFTPNGDGKNEFFKIIADGYNNYSLKIFNRWGQKMFDNNNSEVLWNGKINNTGADAPDGTYFYIFSANDYNEKTVVYKGSVTIIR
ncbi:MAG: gliding motility-associated C-terminal domain-containing protein [Bacteroidota bacterium]